MRKIVVLAKANSKTEKVERLEPARLPLGGSGEDPVTYKVSVTAPPVQGKANDAIQKALSTYFKLPRSGIRLLHGATSKRKIFEIDWNPSQK